MPSEAYPTITSAVAAAAPGDEILVAPGVYTSDHPAHVVDTRGVAITLRSSHGPEVTIIDGEGVRRGIACFNGETSDTSIEGFTIRNGFGVGYDYDDDGTISASESSGAGMYNSGSSPQITHCMFIGNTAQGGGGIYNLYHSNTDISNCTFTVNSAVEYVGGALFSALSSMAILEDTFVCGNTKDQIYGDGTNSGGNLIAMSCICPADIIGDGVVDGEELTYLLAAWGTNDSVVDVNDDGIVDGNDLTIIPSAGVRAPDRMFIADVRLFEVVQPRLPCAHRSFCRLHHATVVASTPCSTLVDP